METGAAAFTSKKDTGNRKISRCQLQINFENTVGAFN
jgi:hypothetical protein